MRLTILLPAIIAAGLGATPVSAMIISASQDVATQGAGVTTDWRGVGNLLYRNSVDDPVDPIGNQFCTGTLLTSATRGQRFVLTAAHCLVEFDGEPMAAERLLFNLPETGIADQYYQVARVLPHPDYDVFDSYTSADIGLLELTVDLVDTSLGWRINRGEIADERGLVGYKVGFGDGGDGVNGARWSAGLGGVKRAGSNVVDLIGPVTDADGVIDGTADENRLWAPADTLIYDFDNHLAGGDGPLGGPATGADEADTASGDSGGPMFMYSTALMDWLIVGVTVFGTDYLSRFGDLAVDTRVQDYADWLDRVLVPVTPTLLLVCLGMLLLPHAARVREARLR